MMPRIKYLVKAGKKKLVVAKKNCYAFWLKESISGDVLERDLNYASQFLGEKVRISSKTINP